MIQLSIASGYRLERYEGVRYLELPTVYGVAGILPGHADFCALLPGGRIRIVTEEKVLEGRVSRGFLEVRGGRRVHLWVSSFAWEGEGLPEQTHPPHPEGVPEGTFVRRVLRSSSRAFGSGTPRGV